MSAPKPKEEFITKLKENEVPYTLTFEIVDNSLSIYILETDSVPSISYTTKFSLSQLVDKSRYFKILNNLEEFMPELKILCSENKIHLKKDNLGIILTITLPSTVVEDLNLSIPQVEMDSKKVIADLCSTVNELKREIKSLKTGQISGISQDILANNLKSKDILLNEEEKKMVWDWILTVMKKKGKKVNMTLLYKMTTHGDSASTFHSRCNNQGYTLTLVRNTKGYRFGGFTTANWSSSNNYRSDVNAFLFSLDYKEYYLSYDGSNAIYDHSSYGPTFGSGNDLYICNNCSASNSSCNFPSTYYGTRYRGLTGGISSFKVNELEVYKIEIV